MELNQGANLSEMPPHEPEAEIAVLGSMIIDSQAAADIFATLDHSCFYDPKHTKIFNAGKAIFDRRDPIDTLTVSAELKKKNELDEIGGDLYLMELVDRTPSSANARHYCEMLIEAARRRKLIHLSDRLKNRSKDQSTPLDIDTLRNEFDEIADRPATVALACRTFADYEREIQNEPDGLKSGFSELDRRAIIPASALTIIAGRPSHGKTTFMLNMMMEQVRIYPNKKFFFFSYEQTFTQLMTLLLIREAEKSIGQENNFTEYWKYVRKERADNRDIEGAKQRLQSLTESGRFWLIDERDNVDKLTGRIRQLAGAHPIGAVYIDYVQKIGTASKSYSRQTELQTISNKIQCMANTLKIPVIMGAQFNREGMKGTQGSDKKNKAERKKIITEDYIREAGDIEQDATLILGLWDDIKAGGTDPNLSVTILKSRYGATGGDPISLKYDRPISKISDFDARNDSDYGDITLPG